MKTYTIEKQPATFYVDYSIKDNKCYIIEEYHNRVKTTFICNTNKNSCNNLVETETQILITI
jgi:hypothetical protein